MMLNNPPIPNNAAGLVELEQRIAELREWFGRSSGLVEALSIAVSIAKANEGTQRGDDARIRISGYLAQLGELGL